MKRTSQTDPIQVAFLDEHLLALDGRIGVTFAPGKKQAQAQSGSWDRDLGIDLARLREHHRTDVLLSLTEAEEHGSLGISDLLTAAAAGMESVHFPISDCSVPTDPAAFRALIDPLVVAAVLVALGE